MTIGEEQLTSLVRNYVSTLSMRGPGSRRFNSEVAKSVIGTIPSWHSQFFKGYRDEINLDLEEIHEIKIEGVSIINAFEMILETRVKHKKYKDGVSVSLVWYILADAPVTMDIVLFLVGEIRTGRFSGYNSKMDYVKIMIRLLKTNERLSDDVKLWLALQ
jgi:hypothetical protein